MSAKTISTKLTVENPTGNGDVQHLEIRHGGDGIPSNRFWYRCHCGASGRSHTSLSAAESDGIRHAGLHWERHQVVIDDLDGRELEQLLFALHREGFRDRARTTQVVR